MMFYNKFANTGFSKGLSSLLFFLHAERIEIMLDALTNWEKQTGDMGGIPEPELVKRL